MSTQPTALEQLKRFLNKLFQFESQDLDFGIYKILHYKRAEIKEFIDKLLVEKAKEQLQTFTSDERDVAEAKFLDLRQDETVNTYLQALAQNPEEAQVLYKYNKAKIDQFKAAEKEVKSVHLADNAQETIYNHLTLFFSRYYDKGDFISKRRYGKSDKYVVPYNGEETHFYWANHDQYYIKSSEFFQNFSFKVPHSSGTLSVHFKLTQAHSEQGNVKAEENKYFVLSQTPPVLDQTQEDLSVFFEFRPLTEAEKKDLSGNGKQDLLNEKASQTVQEILAKQPMAASLWKQDDEGKTLLLRKLNHYTRKNSFDFFIHKDLKGFLQRELDFYVKSELVKVEDLYVLDSEEHFENIRHNFKLIKAFKILADTIIEFLAQIEDFQKKLWEKKKFVLGTEWIITLDKLTQWLEPAVYEQFLEKLLQNEAQLTEWKKCFGENVLPRWQDLTLDDLKADLHTWRKLPLDTAHFPAEFKAELLTALSDKINLEAEADGLVLHSDNYHGLQLLQEKLREQVKAIYIDPPYNTSASEIVYKNSYKHSSWLSLVDARIRTSKELLKQEGILCATIDDFEFYTLKNLLNTTFSNNSVGLAIIKNNPAGRSTAKGFSISHEYALFYSKGENTAIGRLNRNDEQIARYDKEDKVGKFEWVNFRKHGGADANRSARPTLYYPIFASKGKVRIPEIKYSESKREWLLLEEPKKGEEVIYPINQKGEQKRWKWAHTTVLENIKDVCSRPDQTGETGIYIKSRLNIQGTLPLSVWDDKKYSSTEHGTNLLAKIFGKSELFSFPKSVFAVADCLKVSSVQANDVVVDYFPGSGTTFHATQILNQEDKGKRKCVLVEQGGYIKTVILPRIKKIAYSFDWKDGQPKNMNGLGVFVKYQRLEQYEEALENIAFTAPQEAVQQATLHLDTYLPKYFLEFETRGSQSLVNLGAMQNPWAYHLKVWDGYTYDTQQPADLVETFNYLAGLHLQKQITTQHNGHRYVLVWGHTNDQKRLLVVWRNIENWQTEDYDQDRAFILHQKDQFAHDQLYVNGQATVPGALTVEEVFYTKMIPA